MAMTTASRVDSTKAHRQRDRKRLKLASARQGTTPRLTPDLRRVNRVCAGNTSPIWSMALLVRIAARGGPLSTLPAPAAQIVYQTLVII